MDVRFLSKDCEPVNLNEKQAAARYGLSIHWFRRARWKGDGPRYIKLAGRVLYPREELQQYFESKIRRSTSDYTH